MKILLVTGALGYRGTARALASYARILAKKHEVRVWGYDDREETENEVLLKREGICVFIGKKFLSAALDFKPDVINLHRPGIARRRDIDVFKPFHEQGARCIETNVFGRVDPTIIGLVDLSIQVSKWDLWQWNRWKGDKYPIQGVYCPNPVDCDAFKRVSNESIAEMRKLWGIPGHAKVLGRIGNTNWEALEKPLLDALRDIEDLYFIHVDDHIDYMPELIAAHPRVRRIPRLCGARELSAFYSSCDVMTSMSMIGESFGYVNAEAMACGTPVIALSTLLHCNAQSEVVSPGEGGVTIANPSILPRALKFILEDENITRFSARARELIVDRYSFEVCARILDSIFTDDGRIGPDAEVNVDDVWAKTLVGKAEGRYPLGARILFPFFYNPLTAQIIRCVKYVKSMLLKLKG